jgi:hypothetical protein
VTVIKPKERYLNMIQPGDGDPRHGTFNGYSNQRCRCELCREANSNRMKEYRSTNLRRYGTVNKIQPGDGDPRHGTINGYTAHACRCDLCKAVGKEYGKRYRRIKRIPKPQGRN